MNGNYYQNPTFPNNPYPEANNQTVNQTNFPPPPKIPLPDVQVSYIENILRDNRGKTVKAYVSFPDSEKWRDKEYVGTIEEASIDHLIIKDSMTGSWYLIKMLYLDYIEFMEPIFYDRPRE